MNALSVGFLFMALYVVVVIAVFLMVRNRTNSRTKPYDSQLEPHGHGGGCCTSAEGHPDLDRAAEHGAERARRHDGHRGDASRAAIGGQGSGRLPARADAGARSEDRGYGREGDF